MSGIWGPDYWSLIDERCKIRSRRIWATIPPDQFPPFPQQKRIIYEDFDAHGKGGDRRQEIVFIGAGLNEEEISKQMDEALLTDQEMEQYLQRSDNQPDPHHPDVLYYQQLPKTGSHSSQPANQ